MAIYFVLVIVAGYLCGCLESGYLVGKMNGIDIRNYGSGNAGSTNVLRVLGKNMALLTFLGDTLKGFIPVMLVKHVLCPNVPVLADEPVKSLIVLVTGFAVVMGHDYTFFMKFKGGKGVATTGAVMMAFDWKMGCASLLIFIIVVSLTRYVSLSSMTMSVFLLPEMLIWHPGRWDLFLMACLFCFFIVWRHRTNIGRLLNGTESKLGQKVKVNGDQEEKK